MRRQWSLVGALLIHGIVFALLSWQETVPVFRTPAPTTPVIQAVLVPMKKEALAPPQQMVVKKPPAPAPMKKAPVAPEMVALKTTAEKPKATPAPTPAPTKAPSPPKKAPPAPQISEAAAKKRQALEANLQKLAQTQQAEEAAWIDAQVQTYIAEITQQVSQQWIRPMGRSNLQCTLRVRVLPTGEVVQAEVIQSSGQSAFDRSAEAAVQRASPLPMPTEAVLRERLRDFTFTFNPGGAI